MGVLSQVIEIDVCSNVGVHTVPRVLNILVTPSGSYCLLNVVHSTAVQLPRNDYLIGKQLLTILKQEMRKTCLGNY